jgi:hypothetical protein
VVVRRPEWRAGVAVAPLLCAALAACAPDRSAPSDTSRLATSNAVATGAAAAGRPTCPSTGHWTACGVRKRLEAAGVAPQIAESLPNLPAVGPTPMRLEVGRSGLAVYLFADSAARAAAARRLDTLHFISAAKELTMRGETTAIQNDNLLALLFSRNEQQRERVSDALTAGPPQPEKL